MLPVILLVHGDMNDYPMTLKLGGFSILHFDAFRRFRTTQRFCCLLVLHPRKQLPRRRITVHRDMKVDARRNETRMARRDLHLRERPPTRQRMAYKRMSPVVDGQAPQPFETERFARGAEAFADRMADHGFAAKSWFQRADHGISRSGPVLFSEPFPGAEIGQRADIPPQRNDPALTALGRIGTNPYVWPGGIDAKVVEREARDFRDAETATAGEPDDREVHPGGG